ncbi:hypothetical protein D8I30_00470 [Brevundimonas naejangsanensis]|uniref:Uncharacterized protein n=1 Tax=Brevundimonas naejangsanensis TaxID=588932 RepID=A0A494RH36_9CAUL|nr:hypothetical protein [Brevundimonas naejangsanensis]AYG93820.1 hypothetical protein D8I30_00470 [Brevundimonas naejangsanensis]
MSGRYFRVLTPLGWLAVVGAALLLLLIAGRGLGLRWDPLHLQARRLETAQRRAERAEAETSARALEAAARGRQIEGLDAFHRHAQAVERATATAETRARTADDADTPLDPARAQRLHDHDRELCRLAPAVAGCAAPADPA